MKALYFGASWCGQCHYWQPKFEQHCKDNEIDYEVIDIDKAEGLAPEYGIRNLPYIVVLDEQYEVQIKGLAADVIDLI